MQFVNDWPHWLTILVALACSAVAGGADPDAVTNAKAKARWVERLTANVEQLLAEDSLPAHERSYIVNSACSALGVADRAEQAIELADKKLPAHERDNALTLIVASQSEIDDVQGALQTVEQIEHPIAKTRALTLLVARQAQRGDMVDALELLVRIDDDQGQDRARELIIRQYLKDGALESAEKLAVEVVEFSDDVERRLERFRSRPQLSDVDYIPRTVAQAKKNLGLIGISDDQVEFLWHTTRAEVAIHDQDAATFGHAIRDAQQYAQQWSGVKRRSASMHLASLYVRQGDKQAARQEYRAILASFLETTETPSIDWGRIMLSVDPFFSALAELLPAEELEQWIVKLASLPGSGDLIGGVVAGKYVSGATDWCEQMYDHCASPRQRFEVSVRVLQTYGLPE